MGVVSAKTGPGEARNTAARFLSAIRTRLRVVRDGNARHACVSRRTIVRIGFRAQNGPIRRVIVAV